MKVKSTRGLLRFLVMDYTWSLQKEMMEKVLEEIMLIYTILDFEEKNGQIQDF